MKIKDAIDYLSVVHTGNRTVDKIVYEALGWTWHPPQRRAVRKMAGYWRKSGSGGKIFTLPPVSSDSKEAEKLVRDREGVRVIYDATDNKYFVLHGDVQIPAETLALVYCISALCERADMLGEEIE